MECTREKNNHFMRRERFSRNDYLFLLVSYFFFILVVGSGHLNAQEYRRHRSRENHPPTFHSTSTPSFVRPVYVPDVSEAYFFGSSEEVYPDPYAPPQAFVPAEGVSRPVPDEVLRANRRNERFSKMQRFRGRSELTRSTASAPVPSEAVPFSIVFPEREPLFSSEETLPPEFLHQDGTTGSLPHPEEKSIEIAPPQVLDSLENIPDIPEITPPQNQHSGSRAHFSTHSQDREIIPAAYYATAEKSENVAYPSRTSRAAVAATPSPESRTQAKLPYPVQRIASTPSKPPLPIASPPQARPALEMPSENHSSTPVSVSAQPFPSEDRRSAREESIPYYESRRGLEPSPFVPVHLSSQELFHADRPRRIFTESERSTLPWFARYIRDMSAEEYSFIRNAISHLPMQDSLIRASIVASHPSSAERANELLQQYYQIQKRVLATFSPNDTELTKAEKLLQFIHEEILIGGYQLELTTMENLFQGRYNCVTATILYCSLGRNAGLKVIPVELPGHAMCWVYWQDGSKMDIETTCQEWFQYLDKQDVRNKVIEDLILQANPSRSVSSTSRQSLFEQIHPISDEKLLAKIYYNRGVDLLAEKDFAGALEANAIALLLDSSSETTRGNLLATMNNWAIALCQEGHYHQAAELLEEGILHEPEYAMFRNNHVHVFHRWVESLYRSGRYSEALQITERGLKEQPHQPHLQRLYEQIRTVATPQLPALQ